MNAHAAQWIGWRPSQQDAYAVRHFPTGLLVVVCDGMGGHHMGEVASATASQAFVEAFASSGEGLLPDARLNYALDVANDAVGDVFAEHESYGGTTLLAAYVTPTALWWVSVGDSLLCLWRNNRLLRLNEDHSMRPVYEAFVANGTLSHQDAVEQGHVLRSAVTGHEMEMVDLRTTPYPLLPGDRLVLATDGADGLLQPHCFSASTRHLFQTAGDDLAARLIEACRALGDPHADNTTVVSLDLA